MFSAFKRLAGNKVENGISGAPPGHQAMSQNLQRKFAKGVQYNMKIIIKGDRNTGKTCLFHRLQGKPFVQEYVQTEEIQVASIQWSYKTLEDVVKVEVWDVVDKGKKRAPLEGLKMGSSTEQRQLPPLAPALDAEFLDVYKATNGVILLMDITKNWTFEYVQKELEKVPEHIPVLVLGNHCDMSHHRTVSRDVVLYYIESIQRPAGSAQVRYTESSMSNGFGLKYLHKFFGLPFLQLQRETLKSQLERNATECSLTLQELDLYQQGPDSDYDKFLEGLSRKRREVADSVSSAPRMVQSYSMPGGMGHQGTTQAQVLAGPAQVSAAQSIIVPATPVGAGLPIVPQGPTQQSAVERSKSLHEIPRQRMVGNSALKDKSPDKVGGLVGSLDISVSSVEEFVPDGGVLDKSFLEDTHQPSSQSSHGARTTDQHDSDSDNDVGGNPLVAGYQDDLDPDDVPIVPPQLDSPVLQPTQILHQDSHVIKNEVAGLEDWLVGVEGGRESPEGGEDLTSTVDSSLHSYKLEKTSSSGGGKSKSKHKKKSKEKEGRDGGETALGKGKKKKSGVKRREGGGGAGGLDLPSNDLEDFLNSHDTSYEAI